MSLTIGIVGLPNVGKSTLFNALTRGHVLAANYPFATIDPNVGIANVPDHRLDELAKVFNPEKIVPATVSFVDIAGLVKGASEGQGLGNKFLAHIRESAAICQVVRVFSDPNVTHVEGKVDPTDDIATIHTELILADLQTIDKRLARIQADIKKDPKFKQVEQKVLAAKKVLDEGKTLFGAEFDTENLEDMQLLTAKPFIYVFNLDEGDLSNDELKTRLASSVLPAQSLFLCAKVEAELIELPPADAAELLKDLGQEQPGLDSLIQAGFKTLGLQTFLTAGPKEVRAWTVPKGATAPEAAGVIHTDFQKGFIKAEVVNWQDLVSAGSLPAAKSKGQVRLEGKDYIMQDGDVVEFRFNV